MSPLRDVPEHLSGDRYRVIRFLGEGGQKQVYLAHDVRLDRDVVIAMLRLSGLDVDGMARLHREARALARLGDHPHIVAVHDLVEEGGRTYLVAQFVDGGSLQTLREGAPGGRLPIERVLYIGAQLSEALEFAHRHGIVHRDVKPGNIWLTRDGVVKLGDFGLATGLNLTRVTTEGVLLGTVAYMAPEQAVGRASQPSSDLYSLGVVLYELVAGRLPFAGDTVASIVSQHLYVPPVAPSCHAPDIPPELERIILTLLAKNPEDRLPTARAVAHALVAVRVTTRPATGKVDRRLSPLDRLAAGVFVGRSAEMERLKTAFEQAVAGQGSVVLLMGEPGSGKTSTAEQLLTYARVRGADVLRGQGYEGEGAPAFWPWVQILRAYLADRSKSDLLSMMGTGAAVIAQLDPAIADRLSPLQPCPPLEPAQARFRLFDGVTAFLKNASADRPLVIFLDDLHWVDAASLLLLQFLNRELRNTRLLIVGTYRDVQLDRQHPLMQTLGALSAGPGYQRIALSGLTEANVARFIEMMVAAEPPVGLVSAVYAETEGNPFFLKEIVRLLVVMGQFDRIAHSKTWSFALPQSVRDLVNRRLAHLSDEVNEALSIASIVGREFDLDMIVTLLPQRGRGRILEAIEEALAARVLNDVPDSAGRYRFSHALIRETLYDGLSVSRRLHLHRRIGEVLELLHENEIDAHIAEVAHHFVQAIALGDVEKAVGYAVRAAERADALLAYEEAADQYRTALRALDAQLPIDRQRRCELLLARGKVETKAGRSSDARESFTQAAALARECNLTERFGQAALGLGLGTAADRASFSGVTDQFEVALLREALDRIGDRNDAVRARLLAQLALALYRSPDERTNLSEQAVDLARRLNDPSARLAALFSRCIALLGLDRTEERLGLAREIVAVAEQVGDTEMALRGRYRCLRELLELGDVVGVEREIDAYERLAEQVRQPRHSWYVPFCRASLALFRGQFNECERLTAEAIAMGKRSQDSNVAIYCGILIHTVPFLRGRFEDSEKMLLRLIESHPAVQMNNRAILARLYCFMGRFDAARREFEVLAATDFKFPVDGGRVTFVCALATTCSWLGDRRRAEQLYSLVEPFRSRNTVAGNPAISGGPVAQYLAGLAAVLGRWEEAEALYREATARNITMGARPWLALALCGHARMLLGRARPGDHRRAAKILQQALGIGQDLGMGWVCTWTQQQLANQP